MQVIPAYPTTLAPESGSTLPAYGTEGVLKILHFLALGPSGEPTSALAVAEKLAREALQGKKLSEAFGQLHSSERETLQSKIGQHALTELLSLSRETDSELFWESILHFGLRLRKRNHEEVAARVLSLITQENSLSAPVPVAIRQKAEQELNVLEGKGSFGMVMESMGPRVLRNAVDVRVIGPMMGASLLGNVVRTSLLGRLTNGARAVWYSRPLGATLISEVPAYLVEFPAYASLHLAANPTAAAHGTDFFFSSAISVGALRVGNLMGRELISIHRHLVPQLSLFGGMWLSHELEVAWGLRQPSGPAATFANIFGSMISAQVGDHLGARALGSNFTRYRQNIETRSQIYRQQTKSLPTLRSSFTGFLDSNLVPAFPIPMTHLDPRLAGIFAMSSGSEGGGRKGIGKLLTDAWTKIKPWGKKAEKESKSDTSLGPFRDPGGYTYETFQKIQEALPIIQMLTQPHAPNYRPLWGYHELYKKMETLPVLATEIQEAMENLGLYGLRYDLTMQNQDHLLHLYSLYLGRLPENHPRLLTGMENLREAFRDPRQPMWGRFGSLLYYHNLIKRIDAQHPEVLKGVEYTQGILWTDWPYDPKMPVATFLFLSSRWNQYHPWIHRGVDKLRDVLGDAELPQEKREFIPAAIELLEKKYPELKIPLIEK